MSKNDDNGPKWWQTPVPIIEEEPETEEKKIRQEFPEHTLIETWEGSDAVLEDVTGEKERKIASVARDLLAIVGKPTAKWRIGKAIAILFDDKINNISNCMTSLCRKKFFKTLAPPKADK